MNQNSLNFLTPIFKNTGFENISILIINQTTKGKELKSNDAFIRIINSYEYGISKSRNLAIKNAIGDICIITDDDTVFESNAFEIVIEQFKKTKAVLIRFCYSNPAGKKFKSYKHTDCFVKSIRQLTSISSIEIAFDRSKLKNSQIIFNENFGLGSIFKMGEEFLFTRSIYKKKLPVFLSKEYIVRHPELSSGYNLTNKEYLRSKAAIKYIQYGNLAFLWCIKFLFFLIRKKLIQLKNILSIFGHLKNGIQTYKRIIDG